VLPSAESVVSYPEGNTPLLHRVALDRWAGVDHLLLKHEGHNPTGSFKDRGMTVGVTQAVRIGARAVACASTGNTSASLAAYAAQA
jgi:threonine synthase